MHGAPGARRGADLNELAVIPDGALLIRDGVLAEVGTTRRVENLSEARGAVEINAAGRVVMPGFVDSHTHLIFPPPECPDLDPPNAVNAVRTSTAKLLATKARQHLHSMARHGTTTVEAKTGCSLDDRTEIKLLRALQALRNDPVEVAATVLFCLPRSVWHDQPAADSITDWYVRQLLPKVRQRNLARFVDVAWADGPHVRGCFERFLNAARTLGLKCKIHAHQEPATDAIAAAVENFALSVDHLEHAAAGQTTILSRYKTIATLLPYSGFLGRCPMAPAREMIDAGIPVALATDFHPLQTPNLNMQTVVALACREMNLTPAEAISAATINGAHALGCADRTGSLEKGKSADVLMLNASDYREMGTNLGTNLVHLAVKNGVFIYKEGPVARRSAEELQTV